MSHILVDFDGTLASYGGPGQGDPVPKMVTRVLRWLIRGEDVRIFTARASPSNPGRDEDVLMIRQWCLKHLGKELPVTCEKDFMTREIWDDRAIGVKPNYGTRMDGVNDL